MNSNVIGGTFFIFSRSEILLAKTETNIYRTVLMVHNFSSNKHNFSSRYETDLKKLDLSFFFTFNFTLSCLKLSLRSDSLITTVCEREITTGVERVVGGMHTPRLAGAVGDLDRANVAKPGIVVHSDLVRNSSRCGWASYTLKQTEKKLVANNDSQRQHFVVIGEGGVSIFVPEHRTTIIPLLITILGVFINQENILTYLTSSSSPSCVFYFVQHANIGRVLSS